MHWGGLFVVVFFSKWTRYIFYSTAVLFEDAVILGAACDVVSYTMSSSAPTNTDMPFCTLERTVSWYSIVPYMWGLL